MIVLYIAAAVVALSYGGVLAWLLLNLCAHAAGMLFVRSYREDVKRRRRLDRRTRDLQRRAWRL